MGIDTREAPGSGASGGLCTGLSVFLQAKLNPRYDIVMQYLEIDSLLSESGLVVTAEGSIDFQTPRGKIPMQYLEIDSLLSESDLVVTAEGSIDFQTPRGKIPVEVAQRAKKYQLPVIALAGTIGKDAQLNFEHGIDSFESILDAPCTLDQAIANAAERAMRLLLVGQKLNQ